MHRTLIVARLAHGETEPVARAFAESDRTELPRLLGVTSRSLFTFHDLYIHLIETEQELPPRLATVRESPLFTGLSATLADHIDAYDPSWREPRDAMANEFYRWTP
jgi:cyclase